MGTKPIRSNQTVAAREWPRTLAANVRWGVRGGLTFGVIFAGWVTLLYGLGASRVWQEQYHTSLLPLLAFYLAGGAASGTIVGILRPVTATRVGSAFVGLGAAIPVALGVRLIRFGLSPVTPVDLIGVPIIVVALGPASGLILHRISERHKTSAAPDSAAH